MDHDQQVLQLRDFDQQVLSQPENALSFATKFFLETLIDLLEYGLEQNDDGTDAYKEELKIIKNSIKAFTTVLPTVYKTVCQNEAESRLWELCKSLITIVNAQLLVHGNAGVQINAIKCLQVVVLLLSKSSQKDVSLNLLRADHRLLNIGELEKEGRDLFENIIEKLKSDNDSVLTATISCLVLLGKKRTQFLKKISGCFACWRKTETKDDSPVMLRNVDKALKLAFVSLIRTESLAPYKSELIAAFGSIGGNVAMFQSRHSRAEESRRSKRAAQHEAERHQNEKRVKTEYVPTIPSASSSNILTNYDITQIPLSAIVNLCMTVLQTVPLQVMTERVSMLPAEGVTLAVTRRGFVRSTTPPYPPPPEQPQFNTNPRFKKEGDIATVKKEAPLTTTKVKIEKVDLFDSDEEMEQNFLSAPPPLAAALYDDEKKEQKPKVPVLASVEERASQAFKMQPYELASQTELSQSERKELLKMAIQRILYTERVFQSDSILSDNSIRKTITDGTAGTVTGAAVSTHPTKNMWLSLVAKLITRGTSLNYKPTTDDTETTNEDEEMQDNKMAIIHEMESSNDLKDLLLDFIVENISTRNDLALEWLHEEYLFDERNQTLDSQYSPKYFYWFHKLLEKGIPTLDAKDRILTKLLLDAPALDVRTIDMIKENLYSVPERFVSCVSTLRSLVTNRPTVRFLALQVLLDLCTNENDKIRRTSIVAVKKWNTDQNDINTRVEEHSVESLNVLTTEKDVDMSTNEEESFKKGEEEDSEDKSSWNEKDVVRHAELYFVLCTKRPSLLKELFSVYVKASEIVQKYIRLHMINMIKSIGMKSLDLNKLIREFPPGGETLVIRILVILCESKPPTREIISSVQTISTLANERSINLKNLSPILAGHSLSYQATK